MMLGGIMIGAPFYYAFFHDFFHNDWYVPLLFIGVGLIVGLFGLYFAISKNGIVIDASQKIVITWVQFFKRKEERYQLNQFSRVGVVKEYGSSDDTTVEYYVVRLEGDKQEDAQVYAFAEEVAGSDGKAGRF